MKTAIVIATILLMADCARSQMVRAGQQDRVQDILVIRADSAFALEDSLLVSQLEYQFLQGIDNRDSCAKYSEPEVLKRVAPVYPPELVGQLNGRVVVKMLLDTLGSPRVVKIHETTDARFNRSALVAGIQWSFKPARVDGVPVVVWVGIPFTYKHD